MSERKVVWKMGGYAPDDQVTVPAAADMDDETFLKHLEFRHARECKIEDFISRHNVRLWIGMYRTFHDRLHRLATPGQYDHIHEDEEEE